LKKTILVSGANSSLAESVVKELCKKYNVILIYHKFKPKYNFVNSCFFIKYDFIADKNNILQLAKKINKKFKVTAVLHFNGLHAFSTFKTANNLNFRNVFDVNCLTFINLIKLCYNFDFVDSVTTISSVSSLEGNKGISLYSSSKSALNNLVKCAAAELSLKKIRVNAIILGHINQGMGSKVKKFLTEKQLTDLEQRHLLGFGKVEDLIHSIKFLIDKSKSRWITGSKFHLDGGYST
jgi:NAD(P)-dependent dehydrogenase (short-subunit alcohol dehydrogenase family)